LKEKGGEGFERKMKEQLEEIDDIEMERFWSFIFIHNTSPFSFGGLKNYIRGEFWRIYMNFVTI